MPYLIRCAEGTATVAFSFAGALSVLRAAGADASVHTVFGRWVAGRRVLA